MFVPQDLSTLQCDVCILVFSVTDRRSFHRTAQLRLLLRESQPHTPIILVGNKSDLVRSREISNEGTSEGGTASLQVSFQLQDRAAVPTQACKQGCLAHPLPETGDALNTLAPASNNLALQIQITRKVFDLRFHSTSLSASLAAGLLAETVGVELIHLFFPDPSQS